MRLARILLGLSAVSFAGIGVAYLFLPGSMLSIVALETTDTAAFLIRTEGVALLTGAGLIAAAWTGGPRTWRIALWALAFYFVVGSAVDLGAFSRGTVGAAALPSGVVRIVIGGLCAVAAMRLPRESAAS
jgi:hypothetical protein